jgi:ketosteroid isomerase-like protein
MIRDAYAALGRGDLAPWMGLLDRAAVWRAVDEAAVEQAPS